MIIILFYYVFDNPVPVQFIRVVRFFECVHYNVWVKSKKSENSGWLKVKLWRKFLFFTRKSSIVWPYALFIVIVKATFTGNGIRLKYIRMLFEINVFFPLSLFVGIIQLGMFLLISSIWYTDILPNSFARSPFSRRENYPMSLYSMVIFP